MTATTKARTTRRGVIILAGLISIGGCSSGSSGAADGGVGGAGGAGGTIDVNPVVISTTTRKPRTATWSVNYWQWSPTYGDYITGTDGLVAALHPATMRVGGYNNDANLPDPFDDAQLDRAVAYARAIGAEPIIQTPLLADSAGQPPTAATAAAMVEYANVTQGYGLKYFSVGNEPDLFSTSGLPADSTMPAFPGYTPADYCASARAYVTAMKAVDPTIQIVGPDLAYKYQAGGGDNDWLSPVLRDCGDLFDIVSIHRYPFEAKMATLAAATADPGAFRSLVASVRNLMQAAGVGGKPLAFTEMNVVYDATACVLDASPGTVGSALWLADIVGSSLALDIWTSAIWAVADTDAWSLGLIGQSPAHEPRPEYYAYALYADHVGPTLLDVPSAPAGVHAYASRNAADDATEVIVANWNTTPRALEFQVNGLAAAPASPTYLLPAISLAAIEIKDSGVATAFTYGEAQRLAGVGPQQLAAGTSGTVTDGTGGAGVPAGRKPGAGCQTDGGMICSQVVLSSPAITTMGVGSGTALKFGSAGASWMSYAYAASGQTAPTGTATADGNGIQISGGFVAPILSGADYAGFGLYFTGTSCVDGSAYTGVKFDFTGDLGGCLLGFGASFSGDLSAADNPGRGACSGTSSTCYGPAADVTAAALAATTSAPTIRVPFTALMGGSPIGTLDPASLATVQWQLSPPSSATDGGGACTTSFTVANASFY